MTFEAGRRRLALAAFAFFLVLAAAAGCRRSPEVLPPPVPIPEERAEEVLAAIDRHAESVRRYQGLVRVRGRGPEGSFDARLVVLFERPDELRVELLGAFGGTRWSAVTDASGITAYFPSDEHFVREPDVADVVGRLLGLPLDASDIMALLSGAGRVAEPGDVAAGALRGAATELRFGNGDRMLVDETGQVARVETSRYRAAYTEPWKRRGRQIPSEISIESETVRVVLNTEEVDVNVELPPEAFVLEIPPEAERLRPAEVEGEAVFVRTGEPPEAPRRKDER